MTVGCTIELMYKEGKDKISLAQHKQLAVAILIGEQLHINNESRKEAKNDGAIMSGLWLHHCRWRLREGWR
jgi:hypothetical protein